MQAIGNIERMLKAIIERQLNLIGILSGSGAPLLKVAPEIRWVRDFVGLQV